MIWHTLGFITFTIMALAFRAANDNEGFWSALIIGQIWIATI